MDKNKILFVLFLSVVKIFEVQKTSYPYLLSDLENVTWRPMIWQEKPLALVRSPSPSIHMPFENESQIPVIVPTSLTTDKAFRSIYCVHTNKIEKGSKMPESAVTAEADDKEKALLEWKQKKEARKRHREANGAVANTTSNNKRQEDHNEEEEDIIMTAAKKRRMEQEALLLVEAAKDESSTSVGGGEGRRAALASRRKQALGAIAGSGRTDNNEEQQETKISDESIHQEHDQAAEEKEKADEAVVESLLEQAANLQKNLTAEERAEMARKEEEARILREASKVQTNALQAAKEVATGVQYTDPLPTSWRPPRYVMEQGEEMWNKLRKEWHIDVSGKDVPPPLKRFVDMKLPKPIMDVLHSKNILRPSPIQIQGLPVALSSRDMCGIAFTGSGKSLAFSVPLVMAALEEELRMPLISGEGPIGIELAPSRELARQTFDLVNDFCRSISEANGYPELRCQLLIGGESVRDQLQVVQRAGVHCVVATPGRLRDILKRRAMNLLICRFICLDEADRMLDMGFDEEVGEIMNFFPRQRQTLLVSPIDF